MQAVRQAGRPRAARTGEDDDAPAVRGRGQPEVLAVSPSGTVLPCHAAETMGPKSSRTVAVRRSAMLMVRPDTLRQR